MDDAKASEDLKSTANSWSSNSNILAQQERLGLLAAIGTAEAGASSCSCLSHG